MHWMHDDVIVIFTLECINPTNVVYSESISIFCSDYSSSQQFERFRLIKRATSPEQLITILLACWMGAEGGSGRVACATS